MHIRKAKEFTVAFANAAVTLTIYATVLLLPIFFLPPKFGFLDFNKQTLFIALTFVAFFFWTIKTLVSKKITLKIHPIHVFLGVLLLSYLFSTFFSVSPYTSFWGAWQTINESFVTMLCLFLFYLLISSTFGEKEITHVFFFLGIAVLLAQAYGILQLLGIQFFKEFFGNNLQNTVGSVGDFGLFVVVLLPLCMIFSMHGRISQKILFILNMLLAMVTLLLINHYLLWWIVFAGSGLVVLFWILRRNMFDGRLMFLPVFFLTVSLFFILAGSYISFVEKPLEIFLSQKTNIQITFETLKSFPVLGSGPSTFSYDFSKYKSKDFNESSLWNVSFNSGSSKVLTHLTTLGIFGITSLMLVVLLPIFYGIKFLFSQESRKSNAYMIASSLIVLLVTSIGYFFYNSTLVQDFTYFLFFGTLTALLPSYVPTKETKEHKEDVAPSSILHLVLVFVFTFIIIFGATFLFLVGNRYLANIYYNKGIAQASNGDKEAAMISFKKAASLDQKSNIYFNEIALLSLELVRDEVSIGADITKESQKKIALLFSNSVASVDTAIALNPNNVENWSTKGYLCQSVIGLFEDAANCALNAYEKALALAPTNPYLHLERGNTYLAQILYLQGGMEKEKTELLLKAKEEFDSAINLKTNYGFAYLQKAVAARLSSNAGEELSALESAEKYAEDDYLILFQLGFAYYQRNNFQKAKDLLEKTLSLRPDYQAALYYLGLCHEALNQKEKSLEVFLRLLDLVPENQTIQKIVANLKESKRALEGIQDAVLNPVSLQNEVE